MPQKIEITAENIRVEAELNDGPTAKSIISILPIEALAQRWGGEIYFSIPVTAELESKSREVLEAGELGYWPTGNAFCIFFGPTPLSQGDEIRAASAVNVIGKMKGDWSGLWDVPSGGSIVIKIAEGAEEYTSSSSRNSSLTGDMGIITTPSTKTDVTR